MMSRRAFTILELLTVVGVIVTLVGILVVGISAASRSAQAANTRNLMTAVSRALVQFKGDVGYFPPALGLGATPNTDVGYMRDLVQPIVAPAGLDAQQVVELQKYYSLTAPVDYLIGPGGRDEDGYGGVSPNPTGLGAKEMPAVGIRSPLRDGVWGALASPRAGTPGGGAYTSRNLPLGIGVLPANTSTDPNVQGKPLGPYLELKDGSAIGAVAGFDQNGTVVVARPGDNHFNPNGPKVLLDYYGQPIRYYRKGYSSDDPRRTAGKSSGSGGSSGIGWDLSDIFVLRPQRFTPGSELIGVVDGNNDGATSRQLQTADFALFSSGPDQRVNNLVRADPDLFNEDNIVEVGN
jgi:type II secretory pathway pseudopilin PulG